MVNATGLISAYINTFVSFFVSYFFLHYHIDVDLWVVHHVLLWLSQELSVISVVS